MGINELVYNSTNYANVGGLCSPKLDGGSLSLTRGASLDPA